MPLMYDFHDLTQIVLLDFFYCTFGNLNGWRRFYSPDFSHVSVVLILPNESFLPTSTFAIETVFIMEKKTPS